MIRRFNYTDRRKITRDRVRIVVHDRLADAGNGADGGRPFDVRMDLSGMRLPDDAAVFVEAYHRSLYERYPFGTVADLEPRRPLVIPDRFHRTPLFRVKVVQQSDGLGRILAIADKLRPSTADEDEAGRLTILYVEYADLGSSVWKVELSDDDWPRLVLNEAIDGIRDAARGAPEFVGLVYPEVCRRVFRFIVERGAANYDGDDDEDWQGLWLRFARDVLGVSDDPPGRDAAEEERLQWVEAVVEAFAARFEAAGRYDRALRSREIEGGE